MMGQMGLQLDLAHALKGPWLGSPTWASSKHDHGVSVKIVQGVLIPCKGLEVFLKVVELKIKYIYSTILNDEIRKLINLIYLDS